MKKLLFLVVAFFATSVLFAQKVNVKPIKDSVSATLLDKKTNVTYSNTEACLIKYSLSTSDTVGRYTCSYYVEFYVNSASRMQGYSPIELKSYKITFNSYPSELQIFTAFRRIYF